MSMNNAQALSIVEQSYDHVIDRVPPASLRDLVFLE